MRGNELLDQMELIDPAYVQEADEQPVRKRSVWLDWGGMAACLCLVAAVVFAFTGPGRESDPCVFASEPGASQAPSPAVTAETVASAQPDTLRISLDSIAVNEMAGAPVDACRIAYDPALYDVDVPWDQEDVSEYYGRTLAPSYVPEGLTPTNPDGCTRVVIRKADGAVVWDTVAFGYYQVFGTWADGTPRLIDENAVFHGFSVAVSRVGLTGCCVYRYDEVKQSDIAGVPVTIGYCAMSHGPYDPDTHTPAGYYDLYVAEFTLDGIQFQVTADEMALDEVVKAVASIIRPEDEIVLEP